MARARSLYVVLVLVAATAVPSGADTASDDVRVTTTDEPTRSHMAPDLAVAPGNPDRLVAVDIERTEGETEHGTCTVYRSTDGGANWWEAPLPHPEGTACRKFPFPKVAFTGPDGVVAAYYVEPDHGLHPVAGRLLVARSTNGGRTFVSHTEVPRSPTGTLASGLSVPRRLATVTDEDDIEASGSTLQAATSPQRVSLASGAGNVYLAWNAGLPRWVWVSRSTDGGETFSRPVPVTPPKTEGAHAMGALFGAEPPDIAAVDDSVFLAFSWISGDNQTTFRKIRLAFARSDDGGETFSEARPISGPMPNSDYGGGYRPTPSIAVDPTAPDRVYVAYADQSEGTVVKELYVIRSSDGGDTWSDRVRLHDDFRTVPHERPEIAVAPGGRIDAAWYDARNDPNAVDPQCPPGRDPCLLRDVYATWSTNGGESFADNVRVTDTSFSAETRPSGFDDRETLGAIGLASTGGGFRVVWEQSAGTVEVDGEEIGVWDLYTDGIPVP